MVKTLAMFDDVKVELLPDSFDAYACYANGSYANVAAVRRRFPHAHILVIDVASYYRAGDVLDVEKGDATNENAPKWFKARVGQTSATPKPVFYTSAGNAKALVAVLAKAGIERDQYLLWSAHYTRNPHICSPDGCGYPQADATQWTNRAMGRSLDESLVNSYFFKSAPKPPAPKPVLRGGSWNLRGSQHASKAESARVVAEVVDFLAKNPLDFLAVQDAAGLVAPLSSALKPHGYGVRYVRTQGRAGRDAAIITRKGLPGKNKRLVRLEKKGWYDHGKHVGPSSALVLLVNWLLVVSVHMPPPPYDDAHPHRRLAKQAAWKTLAATLNKRGGQWVVAGDFNSGPDDQDVDAFVKEVIPGNPTTALSGIGTQLTVAHRSTLENDHQVVQGTSGKDLHLFDVSPLVPGV